MLSISEILNIFKVLRQRRLRFFFDYFIESLVFDLKRGTNTSFRVTKDRQELQIKSETFVDGILYVASFSSVLDKALKFIFLLLGHDNFANYQFIDLGSGKGKSLIYFYDFYNRFSRFKTIGIDYDKSLCDISNKNLKKVNISEEKSIIINDSAINFDNYIESNNLIVYLYNPFQGKTFEAVIEKLVKFNHILIYVDPVLKNKLIEKYNYQILLDRKGIYNASNYIIASNKL